MPKSALPENFDDSQKGDWNFWPLKYIRPSWTAFGPRCTEWWAKWREFPITLFAIFGKGQSRWEWTDGSLKIQGPAIPIWFYNPVYGSKFYLSAIQYWCDWSFQVNWPFFVAWHWYDKNRKVHYFRFGARRNADGFYDFPSAHIGDWN